MPPASRVFQADALVLRRSDLGEADRIVTLFTREHGKLRAVAKGIRRPTSKLGGHLELFTHSRLLLARGQNLAIITQAETSQSFIGLRDDVFRATFACYSAELIDRLLVENSADPEAFDLLVLALARISTDRQPEIATRLFELQLLGHLGYRPQLHRCASCEATLRPDGNAFSAPAGGVLCPDCLQFDPGARPLSTNAFKVLRLIQSDDYATAARLQLDEPLRRETERIFVGYSEHIIERRVKSAEFLNLLRALG
jgi:DNA repair protein RecO (recombination protein O)